MSTRDRIARLPRPVRQVALPGGATVHVRDLTLAELRRIDARADEAPDGAERSVRHALLLCCCTLCEADGSPAFPDAAEDDLAFVERSLTTSQIRAVAEAAVPDKDAAKN